jgi:hypothetical protein
MLKGEIVGGEVVLVGDYAGAELKLLRRAEGVGAGDQISG